MMLTEEATWEYPNSREERVAPRGFMNAAAHTEFCMFLVTSTASTQLHDMVETYTVHVHYMHSQGDTDLPFKPSCVPRPG